MDLSKLGPHDLLLQYHHGDDQPVQGATYELTFNDGSKRSGSLDVGGKAVVSGVPMGYAKVHYGEDVRNAPIDQDEPNPLTGWMD